MLVKLQNCNNIETGCVEIVEGILNLKYAINGSGKTTIARAILAAIREKTGEEKSALSALIPFKYRKDESVKPEVAGIEGFDSIKVFDEKYINDFVFQADELLKGSFDVFIRNDAYDKGMQDINTHIEGMQKALSEDKDIADLIADFSEISSSFGKETKSGIHGASGLAKAFKGGNTVVNIPAGLEAYKSFIQHPENYKWVKWQLSGVEFLDVGSDCPYCTHDIKERRETIKRVGEVYEPKAIENLNKIVSAFHRLDKYFSDETKAKIAEFVACIGGYTVDQTNYLKEIKAQIDRLGHKFMAAQRLGFSSLKEVEKVSIALHEHRIDLSLFPYLNSTETKIKADIVNSAIDKLQEQVGLLQGMIKKQKALIETLVKEHSRGINEFLDNAGYSYQVALWDDGSGQHRLKLIHKEMDGEISNVKSHLSYGERNAFALVLFMYDVLKTSPSLIVLDDPISSFDKNKKYAIVEMLFRKGVGSLREKTVLLLTHDLEPIVDMVYHHSDRFKKPFAAFLQNNNGMLTEKEFERANIKTFIEIADQNIASDCHILSKLIYARRRQEVANEKGLAFQVISNVLHKRATPQFIDVGGTREMTAQELEEGSRAISKTIPDFDYNSLQSLLADDKKLIKIYGETESNYEKLHLYRIIFEGKGELIESDVVKKFINEAFHIENDYIYQLNPREFQTVPHFVINQCNQHVAALA
ncbi:AAA family ATPase [Acidovorax facilis]|uniref:AAA family ATPase n=1 Tax=Acidovorax facilis TaxID=12917 RepID=UPI003CE6FD59